MLDKDFDQIFKSSFEDFEVAPAADSWNKITKELDKKGIKKFPIFWMAAASVVIVLGIGVGLYTKPTEVIKLKPNHQNDVLANLSKEQQTPIVENSEDLIEVDKSTLRVEKTAQNKIIAPNNAKTNELSIETQEKFADNATNTIEKNVLVEETVKTIKPLRAKLVTEQILEEENNLNNHILPTSIAQKVTDKSQIEDNIGFGKKIKISTVGDLVNFVVAKVDKREEKIIKVSKTEESDNEVTGINLGLFRFIKAE